MKAFFAKAIAFLSPYTWLIVGLGLAGLVGSGLWWYGGKIQEAHEAGANEVRLQRAAAINASLIQQSERIASLTTELTEAANAQALADKNLAVARAAAVARGQRVRNEAAPGGALDDRLEAASCAVRRQFAADAFRTAAACRDDLAEIGFGDGGLVESAAAAHAEKARADALMRFVMPQSPFTKETE